MPLLNCRVLYFIKCGFKQLIFVEFLQVLCNSYSNWLLNGRLNKKTGLMKLRYDPYQVFRLSKTPAGLYARRRWLGEEQMPAWKIDFQQTVNALLANQLPDGSWHHAAVETISRLFGLHLTVRSSGAQINAALNWLLGKIKLQKEEIHASAVDVAAGVDLRGLPFIPSHPSMLLTGAVLFLATIFGRSSDPIILALYQWLSAEGVKNRGRWRDAASSHNIFRAMAVHPVFAKDPATALAVEHLAEVQTEAGGWQKDLPFYQTLNALAHLDLPQADKQLKKAFRRLSEDQNSDGTWSRSEPEWNTFLAIHALKNKGIL
jgi:hypothetical protein